MAALDSDGQLVSYSAIVCLVLVWVVFAMRMWVRYRQRQAILGSDYCIFVAICIFNVYCGFLWAAVYPAGTIDLTKVPPPLIEGVVLEIYVSEVLIGPAITMAKLSILLFWERIFIGRTFRRLNRSVMVISVAWLVAWTLELSYRCTPVRAVWDAKAVLAGAHCRDLAPSLTAYEATNILVDLLILALPVNEVRKLQLPRNKKIAVAATFLFAGFVIVVSAVKIYYINEPQTLLTEHTSLLNISEVYAWSSIEMASSIICACLPTLRPLLSRRPRSSASPPGASDGSVTSKVKRYWARSGRPSNRHPYEDIELTGAGDETSGRPVFLGNAITVDEGDYSSRTLGDRLGRDQIHVTRTF